MWAHVGRGNHVIGELTIAISGVRENGSVLLSCGLRAGRSADRERDTSLALPEFDALCRREPPGRFSMIVVT